MFFVSVSDNEVSYPDEEIAKFFSECTSDTDVILVFEDVHNKFVVPTLLALYELALSHTKFSISLIPKEGNKFGDLSTYKKHEFKPFNFDTFEVGCVGGTFDHMHVGHKLLLTVSALASQKKLYIGVTRRASSKKANANLVYPLHKRVSDVMDFAYKVNENIEYNIEAIDDVAGPVGKPNEISVLILSEETRAGAEAVKKIREERGLKPIEYIMIPLVIDSKSGTKISSTQYRERESNLAKE